MTDVVTDDAVETQPAAPEAPSQDPSASDSPPEPVQAPAAQGQGPWADKLTSQFEDETLRSQVDQFLRSEVQPYVTRLEESTAENRNAERLWQDFSNNPVDTYRTVTEELFGADIASEITDVLAEADDLDSEPEQTPANPDAPTDELPPRVKAVVEAHEEQQAADAYRQRVAELKQANPDIEIDEGLFSPFLVSTQGDWDAALDAYKGFADAAKEKYGIQVPTEEQVAAPPVLGSETTAPSAPPVEQKYGSLDEALDDFFAEQSQPAPPTVGNV